MFEFPDLGTPSSKQPKPASPLADNIEVYVLTHDLKPPVTASTLGSLHIPFTALKNRDWDWPPDHPELATDRSARPSIRGYALRQFRAFSGHQAICELANPDKLTLVFEDDATLMQDTTPAEVIQQINGAAAFITEMGYDAVSFHGREQSPPKTSIGLYGREYVELSLMDQKGWGHRFFLQPAANSYNGKYERFLFRWHEGCLAYMIGPNGRQKWIKAGHGSGLPCDLFLANELNTIVMRNTIFFHDHRHGSIISNTGRVHRQLTPDGTQ